jgi:hypothetical protein
MKAGILNPFKNTVESVCAETELASRMIKALRRLGHEGEEFGAEDLVRTDDEKLDFVLVLHPRTPKLTNHPTYGCLWSPPEWYYDVESAIYKNILSYDGYFVGSDDVAYWLNAIDPSNTKPRPFGRLLPSACGEPFEAVDYSNASLFYIGSNWDRERHARTFQALSSHPELVSVYGKQEACSQLGKLYRGPLPCDGAAVVDHIRRHAIGLCLNHPYHNNSAIPSMRIFETVFSSAIAISDFNPFVMEQFGDSVLYVDTDQSDSDIAKQILSRIEWVRSNPQAASRKAKNAHAKASRFSLEYQLKKVLLMHKLFRFHQGGVQKVERIRKEELHDELALANRRLMEIENSWTWKLTRPIRRLKK